MIEEIKAYRLKCDGCGELYDEYGEEDGHYSILANDDQIQDVLDWSWVEIDNKHYCPNCIPNDVGKEDAK